MIDLRLGERARDRARKLRRVARGVSNARVEAVGDEADRIRRRRATLVGKLNTLALAQDRAAENPDWDEDPAHVASALDATLDAALGSFAGGQMQQGIDQVVGSLVIVDEILQMLNAPDADEPGMGGAASAEEPVEELAEGVKHTHAKEGGGQQTHTHPDAHTGHAHAGLLPLPAAASSVRSVEQAREEGALKIGYRAMECGVRAAAKEGDGSTLFGHFAVFNEWTEIDSMWEGHFMEQIAPGAFKQTFSEDRENMRVLLNHGRDPELGSKPIATIEELAEDEKGASYAAQMLRGVPDLVTDGISKRQYGASFRFEVLSESWVDKPKRSDYNPMGLPERTMTGLKVAEFGPVTFPQYTSATAGLRSLTDAFMSTGRPIARSVGGGGLARVNGESTAVLAARDRELRLKGVIKQ